MHTSYNYSHLYVSELPDLFSKFYSAETLWQFYSTIYLPMMQREVPPKRIKKQLMVDDLVQLTDDPEQVKRLVAAMPLQLRTTIESLLWIDKIAATKLEKQLGFLVYQPKSKRPNYWDKELPLQKRDVAPELDFIVNHDPDPYGYSGDSYNTPHLSLPPELKKLLRPHFPKPAGYDFTPLKTLSDKNKKYQYFDGSGDILTALSQLADYLLRTKLQTTKTGKISKPTLRAIIKITAASEPFATDTAHKEFAELRHLLLINWLLKCTPKDLIDIAEGNKAPGSILREIVKAIVHDTDFIHDELLTHIKLKSSYFGHDSDQVEYPQNAVDLIFKQLPKEGWITRENIQHYQNYRYIQIHTTATNRYYTKVDSAKYSGYPERINIGPNNFTTLLEHPLLDGLTFFFAAFGLLEIAFTPPSNSQYIRPKKDYLTPFEGIYALRLTELGAYAFGHTKKLEIKASKARRAEMHFNPARLHMRCVDLDPVTELTVKEFMDPIGPSLFRLTRSSLIGKATKLNEIKLRIQDFKKRVSNKLPDNWLQFIKQLESEEPALHWRSSLGVYHLTDNPALREAFSKDPKLRELCFKAEGWHVIVEQKNMIKLKDRIRQLGYICE
jgi:hypothetical protein